jgi:hypothetical protein
MAPKPDLIACFSIRVAKDFIVRLDMGCRRLGAACYGKISPEEMINDEIYHGCRTLPILQPLTNMPGSCLRPPRRGFLQ